MVRRVRSWGPCHSRVSCCFLRLENLAHFVSFLSRLIHSCCSHGCTMRRVFLRTEKPGLISQTVAGNQAYLCYKHWDKVGLLAKMLQIFFFNLAPYAYSASIHSTQGSGPAIQIVMSCCRLKPRVENRSDLKYIPCLTWICCKEQHHQWNHFSWRIQQHHYLHRRQLYHTSQWWLDLWGSVILK